MTYNLLNSFLNSKSSHSTNNSFLSKLTYNRNNNNMTLNMFRTGSLSNNSTNLYFSMVFTVGTEFYSNSMYLPIVENISNLIIENDYSIKISFNNVATDQSMVAMSLVNVDYVPSNLFYKNEINLNNSTFFPIMQDYVKSDILNIV